MCHEAIKPAVPTASVMLSEAANIVAGDRNETHGSKERSFAAIAYMWTSYLSARRQPNGPIRPADVAQMMVLLKQQRAEWGQATPDHFVDAGGYSAIAGELMLSAQHDAMSQDAPRS